MRRYGILVAFLGIFILRLSSLPAIAQHHHVPGAEHDLARDCAKHLPSVVKQFATKEGKQKGASATVILAAYNDVRCGDVNKEGVAEPMANALVLVENQPDQSEFVLIHVHFTPDGMLVGAAKHKAKQSEKDGWTKASDTHAWKQSWCHFIFSVYPKEATKQNC